MNFQYLIFAQDVIKELLLMLLMEFIMRTQIKAAKCLCFTIVNYVNLAL